MSDVNATCSLYDRALPQFGYTKAFEDHLPGEHNQTIGHDAVPSEEVFTIIWSQENANYLREVV